MQSLTKYRRIPHTAIITTHRKGLESHNERKILVKQGKPTVCYLRAKPKVEYKKKADNEISIQGK